MPTMDTSADDPHTFRIRRSPSIGSGSASIPPSTRVSNKRKLSTTAFGSSPSLGSNGASSPSTAEHSIDDREANLQHSLSGPSPIASSSRNTLDTSDHTISVSTHADAAHDTSSASRSGSLNHVHELQERRCHGVRGEYDYASVSDDRRDPRISSTACLVVPSVSTPTQAVPQPEVGIATDSVDREIHRHGKQRSSETDHNIADGEPIASDQVHHAPLQPSLSQQTFSHLATPERRTSPTPSFEAFYYQTPSPHLSSSHPSQSSHSTNHHPKSRDYAHEFGASSSMTAFTSTERPHSSANMDVASAQSTESATTDESKLQRSWFRTTSLQSAEAATRPEDMTPLPSQLDHKHGKDAEAIFQLQPVPPLKKRKLESGLVALENIESRRLSDVDLGMLRNSSQSNEPAPTADASSIDAVRCDRGEVTLNASSEGPQDARSTLQAECKTVKTDLRSSKHTTKDLVLSNSLAVQPPALPSLSNKASLFTFKNKAILPAPSTRTQPHQSSSHRRRAPRLRRAQSVPNLRAKATLDVAAPSQHRLVLPPHWVSYISSMGRSGRDGTGGNGRGSTYRSSKGMPLSLAQYSIGSTPSRSRSTFTPALHPPITRHTLRELDLFEILKNPQLRHDVVFDPNVQFRPNFDGERGRRKREAGERYWTAVVREIEIGCTCTAFDHGRLLPCTCSPRTKTENTSSSASMSKPTGSVAGARRCKGATGSSPSASSPASSRSRIPSRIPLLVQELRAICLSILPSNFPAEAVASIEEVATSGQEQEKENHSGNKGKDLPSGPSTPSPATSSNSSSGPAWATSHHQLIAQTLDPHLIAQELQHGVLDVPALITFMGSILKLHCAPMRDEAIEKMVEVVCVDNDIGKGLRLCFEILELMKLDIANHQLRSTRPYLVETAVDFEVRWFKEQMEQGKMALDRTTTWFQRSLTKVAQISPVSTRSEAVSQAFNEGIMQLIFDIPGTLPVLSTSSAPLASPSSSSLNTTFASYYPETFQFDAYRMMTFHNDVADLTIVYMLLLLFRQLSSSPLDDSAPVPASAATIAQNQLKTVKGEIWCLLNDANLCLSSSSAYPPSPTVASSGSKRAALFDGKLFLGSAGGFAKLDHPRWRRAMQNVLLQVAARASAVQEAARQGVSDLSKVKPAAPSTKTQKLLNSWMESNLCSGSVLHKLCQKRLREIVMTMLSDKIRAATVSVSLSSSSTCSATPVEGQAKQANKRASSPEAEKASGICVAGMKRAKTDKGSSPTVPVAGAETSPSSSSKAVLADGNWEATLTRSGLEPFAAEIRLLSDRIAKVAVFHLRVFRNLYEKMDVDRAIAQ